MTVTENPNPLLLNDRPDLHPVALLQANGDGNGDRGAMPRASRPRRRVRT